MIDALSSAYPLPATITEAAAEYAMWERRNRDLGLVLEDTSDTQLDLPAYFAATSCAGCWRPSCAPCRSLRC